MGVLELKAGEQITTENGRVLEVVRELGRGGQGIVYLVRNGTYQRALKWYTAEAYAVPEVRKPFQENLWANVLDGVPEGGENSFIWPIDMVISDAHGTFGYLMELIPPDYVEFSRFQADAAFSCRKARIQAMIGICQGFQVLHQAGYKYQDINNGNVFIRPQDGSVLICDNDNASKGDRANGVIGKDWYMAPEVVMQLKGPDQTTDRFSLALLLFYLVCKEHPLLGRAALSLDVPFGPAESVQLFGSHPVFLFDPQDASNRPDPVLQPFAERLWRSTPDWIRELFVRSFSRASMQYDAHARRYAGARVTEAEWLAGLYRWKNSLVDCVYCGAAENVFDPRHPLCRHCGRNLAENGVIQMQRYLLPLTDGVTITDTELSGGLVSGAGKAILIRRRTDGPDEGGTLRLGNDLDEPIRVVLRNGEEKILGIRKSAPVSLIREVKTSMGSMTILPGVERG